MLLIPIPDRTPFPLLTAYRYDQLHRLTASRAYWKYTGNTWDAPVAGTYYDSYKMELAYDLNGNIKKLLRNGVNADLVTAGSNYAMDSLTFKYKTIAYGNVSNSNQLYGLKDIAASAAANYGDDIETTTTAIPAFNSTTSRYNYDAIGNLIEDKGEYIASIEWTLDRKVRRIIRNQALLVAAGASVNKSDIEYEYNSMRQRVVKNYKTKRSFLQRL